MNILIKQILYHTHDKWNVPIKYREETLSFLQFALEYDETKTEFLLKDILRRINEAGLLIVKGLLLEFNKHMPLMFSNYIIKNDTNKLIKYYKE